MIATSIPAASMAPMSPMMKAASAAAGESGFKFNDQLHAVLNRDAPAKDDPAVANGKSEQEGKQGDSSDDETGEPVSSKQERPQLPLILTIVTAMVPPQRATSFGLPSAGVEPGSNGECASIPADTPVNADPVSPAHTVVETLPRIEINAPAAPAENRQPEMKGELAFALRLADEAPSQEVAPQQPAPLRRQQPVFQEQSPTPQQGHALPMGWQGIALPHGGQQPPFLQQSSILPQQTIRQAQPVLQQQTRVPQQQPLAVQERSPVPQPQRAALRTIVMPLDVEAQPAQDRVAGVEAPQTTPLPEAAPISAGAALKADSSLPQSSEAPASPFPQPRCVSAQSNQQGFDNDASEKQPAKQAPKPERSQAAGSFEPVAEPKPVREFAMATATTNAAHREIGLQAAPPPQSIAVPAPTAPRVTEPASNVTPAPAVEHMATDPVGIRTNPNSQVTEVSVTIPVPRTDAGGEERIAVRMVRRGAEIHVSVRTPDHQLTQSLRQDLGKLTENLDQAGFRTESWRPVITHAAAGSQTSTRHEFSQGAPYQDSSNPDGRSRGQQQRGAGEQRRRQQDERPRWVAELEQFRNR